LRFAFVVFAAVFFAVVLARAGFAFAAPAALRFAGMEFFSGDGRMTRRTNRSHIFAWRCHANLASVKAQMHDYLLQFFTYEHLPTELQARLGRRWRWPDSIAPGDLRSPTMTGDS
jgi:hypothetical protein